MQQPTDSDIQLYTYKQLQNVYGYVEEIINTLNDKALEELLSGYDNDVERLIEEMTRQTNFVINHNASKLNSESLGYLNELEHAMDMQLKKFSLNYFKATVLTNFEMGWRNLEWGNMIQLYPWSAYLAQRGSGKCVSPNTLVVMYDGSLKEIQYIKVGDLVMGVDSTPRKVLSIHRGVDVMYEIKQANSENYITNSRHVLHFKRGSLEKWYKNEVLRGTKMLFDDNHTKIVEMSTKEFHQQSRLYKSKSFGYRIKGWDLPAKDQKIEPYFVGMWLGDGTSINQNITNIDSEVIEYLKEYSDRLGNGFELTTTKDGKTHKIKIKRCGRSILNPLNEDLKYYNLIENKHIPENYLLGSREQRLQLLAGLIDSDGTTSARKTSYSISQKDRSLLEQVQQLCWSLGFRANLKERKKRLNYKNNEIYTSYDLHFSGDVWEIPCKIKRKKIEKYERVQDSQRSKLDSVELKEGEYCGFECDGDHLFLLKDGTVLHNSFEFCYAVPLWRLYTYDPPQFVLKDNRDNRNRKETAIITNESRLGGLHINKITEEIRNNDILKNKLNKKNSLLGKEAIITDTGSMLHLRSFGSQIRGLHVGYAGTDDFLTKSALYSSEQRAKFHEVFYAEIKNIVEPGGFNIVSGTPFHVDDLYGDLKNDSMFKVFEYPGVFPDGRLLAPDRFSFQYLMDLKKSLGSIVFSREILVMPVSDGSSLFPWEFLNKSLIGMENIRLVNNIESFPIKLKKVVIGCDFAKSATIGADFTVYTVWGADNNNIYYLLHVWRKRGASTNEQVNKIVELDHAFRPNKIVCESNGFQSMIAEMARNRGLKNVEDFKTVAGNKKSDYEGLPSLSAVFERGEIKMPGSQEEETHNMVMHVLSEFNNIGYNEDKGTLEATSDKDDCVMSSWIALYYLIENKVSAQVFYV